MSSVEVDLPLFAVLQEKEEKLEVNPVIEELEKIDVDSLSPREALDMLYNLKAKL